MKPKIGLQIGNLHQVANENNLKKIIKEIDSFGYDGIEIIYGGKFDFLDIKNKPPSFIKSILETVGLELISSHVDYEELKNNLGKVIEYHEALDCEKLVIPRTQEDDFENESKINKLANELRDFEVSLSESGFDLAFHNCYFQSSLDRTEKLKHFDEKTDEVIRMQLDSGNGEIMGIDVTKILKSSSKKFYSLHVKDGIRGEKRSYSLGKGNVDLHKFIKISKEVGVPWLIIEDEDSENPLKAAKQDYDYLRDLY